MQYFSGPGYTAQFPHELDHRPWEKMHRTVVGKFSATGRRDSANREKIIQTTKTQLVDMKGTPFPNLQAIYFLTTGPFNDQEGNQLYPRPFIYTEEGEPIQQGDIVLIGFIDASYHAPIVLGTLRPANPSAFFPDYEDDRGRVYRYRRENEKRTIEVIEDGEGNLSIDLKGKGQNQWQSSITVKDGKVTINTTEAVFIGGEDGAEPIPLGNKLEKLLDDRFQRFLQHAHPVQGNATGVPVPDPRDNIPGILTMSDKHKASRGHAK